MLSAIPIRRRAWKLVTHTLPKLPRGSIAGVLRHGLIQTTRLAPLELTLAKGDTAVLVGAVPKGEVWDMLRIVGPQGHVVAVEACLDSVEAIEDRAWSEGIENLSVIPKGAWSEKGTQTLYLHPQFDGSHIVLDSGAKHDRAMDPSRYAGAITIPVEPLDDILHDAGIERCDFIKITVMGAEMQVLKGMDRLLQSTPKLWVKAHSLIDGAPANVAISRYLRQRGYRTLVTRGNLGPGGVRPGDVYATRR